MTDRFRVFYNTYTKDREGNMDLVDATSHVVKANSPDQARDEVRRRNPNLTCIFKKIKKLSPQSVGADAS